MNKFYSLSKRSFAISLMLSAFVFINPAYADAQTDSMQRAMLNMQNQIQQLQDKLAESQGQIEELNHEKKILAAENEKLKAQISQMAANTPATPAATAENTNGNTDGTSQTVTMKTETGGATATLSPAKKGTVAKANLPAVPADAQKLYQDSYALLNKGDLDAAAKGFKSYTSKYSNNALTPNAWYWLGQIQYKQNKFQDARISFLNTAKFKDSDKRADALYKLGVTSKALGDKEKAKKFFDVLIKTYPTASSSALAKKELQSL
ncbi:tol-pal system protein YbgF [Succinivibrio dextrinosolvens]|uniref:tol-pal system protein YbgF n=1 Tax=Succinivibrio dextrinosolvens TaxID=83771 RepID=UPI0004E1AE65|nr:tol-pal system protein YbgF [Succinivibrio dextrinosolvens]